MVKLFRLLRGGVLTWGIVLLLSVMAFIVRALPWRNFLGKDGSYLFYGPDSYDHLRRITLGIGSFPRIPSFDSYYGFPVGTGQIWSPLFDYLLSLIAIAIGGKGNTGIVIFTGFWLPPVLASLTVLLVYVAGSRLFNTRAGVAAAAIGALLPGHILYSLVSELDNNVAEPLLMLALVISVQVLIEAPREDLRRVPPWVTVGFWLVFAILMWRGAVIFWGIALATIAIRIVVPGMRGDDPSHVSRGAVRACLLAALALLPFTLFNFLGSSGGVSFGIVSWFHVIILLICAVLFHLSGYIVTHRGVNALKWVVPAFMLPALIFLLPAGRQFLMEFVSGIAVIGGRDPWLDSISELRPMLFPAGDFNLRHATETLSFLYWILPFILVFAFLRWRKGDYREHSLCLFLVAGLLSWLLPLFRERYVHLAAIVVALGGGWLFSLTVEWLGKRGARQFTYWIASGVMLLMLAPVVPFLLGINHLALPDYEKYDLQATLSWMRDNTTPTSHYERPLAQPEYGVLSDWSLGAYIDYVARRPTVATNFGWETHGLFESAAFLTGSDPEQAARIISENRVRYLLLNNLSDSMPGLRAIAEYGVRRGKFGGQPLPDYRIFASMYFRLYIMNGATYNMSGIKEKALGNYRLVYESPGGGVIPGVGYVSFYKVFELVPGAVIKGRGPAGKEVTIELGLKGAGGRELLYRDSTVAGAAGAYSFRVPYATDTANGDFTPLGGYRLATAASRNTCRVSESDIAQGRVVTLP